MTLTDEIREKIALAQQALLEARTLLVEMRMSEMNTCLCRAQRYCQEASIVYSDMADMA